MKRQCAARIVCIVVMLTIVFTVFSARLIDLQIARHQEYSRLAAEKNTIRQVIPARRGTIRDCHGEILADNLPMRTVVADGSHIVDPTALAKLAAPYLEMEEAELRERIRGDRKYVVVRRKLPEGNAIELSRALQAGGLKGLYFEPDSKRSYPNNGMLCHLIGFLDHDGEGIQGIEKTMESQLDGEDGFRHMERDRTGREIVIYRGQEQEPRNGADVYLTIDMGLQCIVEEELDAAVLELQPETAVALFVRPATGEIVACASRPGFDLNDVGSAQAEQMKNRAIIDMVEPGSTFKIVVASAAINERVATDATRVFCENGSFAYGGKILRDHHGYGSLGVHEIIVKSSNIGSAKLAMMMGEQRFYDYVTRFGFGRRSGVDLPGEIPGVVHPPHRWDKLTITRMPMGHSVAVTPLQIVMAMGAIANQGRLMKPQIVSKIVDEKGVTIRDFQPEVVREVVTPETAAYISDALREVVGERGTARRAHVDGYAVAGKTGTAQKVSPKGGYMEGKYVVSFAGYFPADKPELVGLVLVDNARLASSANYGGLVAAPVFARIAARAARYLNLTPTEEGESTLALNTEGDRTR